MTPTGKIRIQPGLYNLAGQTWANQPSAQRQHVGIVVLAAIGGCGLVVTKASAHAWHLVGRHARADARAVHDNATPDDAFQLYNDLKAK